MKGQETLFSHKSDEWETPQDLFDALDYAFVFTLDPCATPENAKCKKFYTKEDNGLTKSWENETAFVNPPYSQIEKWVLKSLHEKTYSARVVMLLPARTDTKWFKYILETSSEIYFIEGRLKFKGAKSSAPFPSMIVYLGIKNQMRPHIFSVTKTFKFNEFNSD